MPNKTPKFNAALDRIFSILVPHERVCKQCGLNFQIETEDIEFLKKLRVPPPTLCPRCRLQRRAAYRANVRPIFHKKICSAPGHTEEVLTYLHEKSATIVYDDDYYRSDEWEPFSFGISYTPDSSFFEQFAKLTSTVPRQTLGKDPNHVNCKYVLGGKSAKNCYYVVTPYFSENLQYGTNGLYSKDSIAFFDLDYSENCYSCVNVARCFDCKFSINSSDCVSSSFIFDCKNCFDCFGATNLRNGRYVFFNEQLSKEEYFCKLLEIDLGSYTVLEDYKARFKELMKDAIYKNLDNLKTNNSTGNALRNCNNCVNCFRVMAGGGENLRHTVLAEKLTDCMDFYGGVTSTLLYESSAVTDASRVFFSILVRVGQQAEYSLECNNVTNVFGCIGLKNKSFCIFNKQYEEDEYWPRLDELKTAMLARGEYGEFFPIGLSPIAYNESAASVEFPLTKDEATNLGYLWHEENVAGPKVDPATLIQASDLPDNIRDIDDSILHKAVLCIESGRPFRFNKEELTFYRKHRLALPRLHPDVRILKLLEHRIPYRLWDDVCKQCGKEMKSGYDPTKNYKVYCESCYQQEIV